MGTGACVVVNYDDCMAENRTVLEANQCKAHRVYRSYSSDGQRMGVVEARGTCN